ncbi:MAG TPA: RNA polymerase sigma factor [Saprospiraceae bacterium]|nr:RNA polymerase sigma factor [Saprospiraceae bacterium]HNM23914.1 RNA polymerase sigma factor [Saprospiraceae bacterium]
MPPLNFLQAYEQHRNLVFNLCLHYLTNRQEAEEAAQDIFIKIHSKIDGFQEKSSLKTWIYRIAVNHCLDVLKARKRQKRLAWVRQFFSDQPGVMPEPPDFNHPGVLLEDREALELLFRQIHQLPDNQKTALILRYLDELPPPEIAEVMGCSLKAVESLLQRAKQNLEKKRRDAEGP